MESFWGRSIGRITALIPRAHVTLGGRCWVSPRARFIGRKNAEIRVGDGCVVYRGVEILGPVYIDDRCYINRDAYIRPYTTVGKRVGIGAFVRILTDTHEIGPSDQRVGTRIIQPVTIEDGAWIGAGSIILPGVTIGRGAVVAAGSTVTMDVIPDSLVAGSPARLVRMLDGAHLSAVEAA